MQSYTRQRWSGADLQGKAASYSGRYARSRANLLARIEALPSVVVLQKCGPRGLRYVEILERTPVVDSAIRLAGEPAKVA